MMYPKQEHLDAVMHVIGYLVNTSDIGITYGGRLVIPMGLTSFPPGFHASYGLYAYTDASWNKRPLPHGGHAIMISNGAILWSCKKLKVIPDSTAEAETNQGSKCTKDLIFVRAVYDGANRPVSGPSTILVDCAAMHHLVVKEGSSQRPRYYERATILIKYAIMRLIVRCELITTDVMAADIFTKATEKETFLRMKNWMMNLSGHVEYGQSSHKARKLMNAALRLLDRML